LKAHDANIKDGYLGTQRKKLRLPILNRNKTFLQHHIEQVGTSWSWIQCTVELKTAQYHRLVLFGALFFSRADEQGDAGEQE